MEDIIDNNISIYSLSEIEDILHELLEIQNILGIEEKSLPDLEDHILDIYKISNSKIHSFYDTAETLFHNFKDSGKLKDASLILLGYTNVFETILDGKVSSCLRSLVKKYKTPYFRRETTQKFNNTFGHLMNGESIALGQWLKILENINNIQEDHILQEFCECLKNHFDENTFSIIKKACEYIRPLRNPTTHTELLSMDNLIPLRKEVIKLINPVIDSLY